MYRIDDKERSDRIDEISEKLLPLLDELNDEYGLDEIIVAFYMITVGILTCSILDDQEKELDKHK